MRTSRILELAMGQIERRGIEGLTLQEIARELDYTVAALYRYFRSKDALVAELQRRVVALLDRTLCDVEQRCSAWIASIAEDERERIAPLAPIVAAGLFYAGLARSAPQAFAVLAASLGDPRRLIEDADATAVIETAQPMFDRLAHHDAAAVEAGSLDAGDSADRGLVFWAALHGVAQLGKLERLAPSQLDTMRLSETLLQTLLVGWGADPGRVGEAIDAVRSSGVADATITSGDLASIDGPTTTRVA